MHRQQRQHRQHRQQTLGNGSCVAFRFVLDVASRIFFLVPCFLLFFFSKPRLHFVRFSLFFSLLFVKLSKSLPIRNQIEIPEHRSRRAFLISFYFLLLLSLSIKKGKKSGCPFEFPIFLISLFKTLVSSCDLSISVFLFLTACSSVIFLFSSTSPVPNSVKTTLSCAAFQGTVACALYPVTPGIR